MKKDIHTSEDIALVLQAPSRTQMLAAAGILGPVLFPAGFLLLGLLRRGRYDPIAEQVSNLTAGLYGWAQQANFIVFGLLLGTTVIFRARRRRGAWSSAASSHARWQLDRAHPSSRR